LALVIDASVVLAWLMPDEQTPAAERIIGRLTLGHQAQAPALLPFEVGNALLVAQRRRRITASVAAELEREFGALPIAIAPADQDTAARAAKLAREHGLSVYDAAYLDLARQRRFALATLDAGLRKAAQAEGLTLAD
jgi:predicted nucleic acid-binding protein